MGTKDQPNMFVHGLVASTGLGLALMTGVPANLKIASFMFSFLSTYGALDFPVYSGNENVDAKIISPKSFLSGAATGVGALALAYNLAAHEAPQAPDVPVQDAPAAEQQAPKHIGSGSHEQKLAQIAANHGLTLG